MYIFPGYTKHFQEDGVIYVSSDLRENKVALTDPAIQEEFRSLVKAGGCSQLSTPLTRFLHEQELLESGEEITRDLKEAVSQMEHYLLLTVMPTEGCNFRCPYCYENHEAITMTQWMLDQILDYIREQAPRFRFVHLSWFGGEPTLCGDNILEFGQVLRELQREHGFQVASGMTTNGYLLDMEHFRQYYAVGITDYQITLDGWDHDKTRPHVTGQGTLQTILENLTALSALPREDFRFSITLRRNILAGNRDFGWYDFLREKFGGDPRFSVFVKAVGDFGGEGVKKLALAGGGAEALVAEHNAYLDRIGMRCGSGWTGPFSGVCYASYPHSLVFRPNGAIEKCTVALGRRGNRIGYLDKERGMVFTGEPNRFWCEYNIPETCHTCPDVLTCLNMRCRRPQVVEGSDSLCCAR